MLPFKHVFEGWVSTLISTDQPRLAAAVSLRYVMSVRAALAHVKTRAEQNLSDYPCISLPQSSDRAVASLDGS